MKDLIFDIGMNVGEDTDFYLKKGFRVVAVEANPAVCRDAAEKYRDAVATKQLTIVNRAISSSRDPVMLYVCGSNSAWSTASPRLRDIWGASGAHFQRVEVPGILARDLIAAYGVPYYMKIDIEGSDMLCLDALTDGGPLPPYLSLEVDFYRRHELLQRLAATGYRRFALIGQTRVVEQQPPWPAREGRYVDYHFRIGSTGLFGDEMPEMWRGDAAIRRRCEQIVRQYRAAGALRKLGAIGLTSAKIERATNRYLPLATDWYDLHAARD
jgi:FkbM family methyltransferase